MHIPFKDDYSFSIIPDYKKGCYLIPIAIVEQNKQLYEIYPFGGFLADLANLDVCFIQNFLKTPVKKIFELCHTNILRNNPNDYDEATKVIADHYYEINNNFDIICNLYSNEVYSYLSRVLASDILDRLEEINYSPANVNDLLFPNIIYLEELKNLSVKLIKKDYKSIDQWDYDLITNTQIILNIEDPLSSTSYYSYKIKKISDIIAIDNVNFQKNNTTIKLCQNCGKYFIPSSRSDEIYCDNIYKDGKTCKEMGYEIKLKNDEFKTAYRRAYKTQRARIKYNNHIEKYEELHFTPWEKAAKQALAEYTTKNNIEGFLKWIKDNKDLY